MMHATKILFIDSSSYLLNRKFYQEFYGSNLKYDSLELRKVENKIGQLLTNQPESK